MRTLLLNLVVRCRYVISVAEWCGIFVLSLGSRRMLSRSTPFSIATLGDENAGEFIRWVYKTVLPRQLVLKYFECIKLVFSSSNTPLIVSLFLRMLLLRSFFSLITLLFTPSFLSAAEPLRARAQGIETTTKTIREVSSLSHTLWYENYEINDSQRLRPRPISKPLQKPQQRRLPISKPQQKQPRRHKMSQSTIQ
jgi:hypothetical protein